VIELRRDSTQLIPIFGSQAICKEERAPMETEGASVVYRDNQGRKVRIPIAHCHYVIEADGEPKKAK